MHALLNGIAAHPTEVLFVVFLIAFAESIVLIGTLVPAGIVMFTAGALIGAGALNVWITLGVAVLGAIAGDSLSYELGYRYDKRIKRWRAVQRQAALLHRGEQFIQRHGGKSILFARFIAPVRAVVPFLAGIGHMPRKAFYIANGASALVWSPVHILPGVIFGASIQLAEAVSGRIALILILLAALLWLVAWLARNTIRHGMPTVLAWRDRVLHWTQQADTGRFFRFRLGVSMLLDPQRPGSQALLAWAMLWVGSSVVFLLIVKSVIAQDSLVQLDAAVFNMLQALRTAPIDSLMIGVSELGSIQVRLTVALAAALWLIFRRCPSTAGYWAVMAILAEGLMRLLALLTARAAPLAAHSGHIDPFSFPSGHATSTLVIYGFLAYLVASRQSAPIRATVAAATAMVVILIGISRLYLGAQWLSDVLAGWSFGFAWLALAIIVYSQRRTHENLRPAILGTIALAAMAISGFLAIDRHFDADLARYTPQMQSRVITPVQWADTAWRELPTRRIELGGDDKESFPLQWAESADRIRSRLQSAGWLTPPPWTVPTTLLWLTPDAAVKNLPVLPKYNQGKSSELAFVLLDVEHPRQRTVLRLWRSRFQLKNPRDPGKSPVFIWYGAFYVEQFKQPLRLFTLGLTRNLTDEPDFLRLLPAGLKTQTRPALQTVSASVTLLALPE